MKGNRDFEIEYDKNWCSHSFYVLLLQHLTEEKSEETRTNKALTIELHSSIEKETVPLPDTDDANTYTYCDDGTFPNLLEPGIINFYNFTTR